MRARRRAGVRVEHVWKSFGTLQVLTDASLSAAPGEIHALIGENGAGKTTLMRILTGLEQADEGEVSIGGRILRRHHTAKEALEAGAGIVPQHSEVVPGLSVLENLVLGAEPSHLGLLRREAARQRANDIAERLGFDFDWASPAQALGLGQRQRLDLLRLLWRDLSVLVLDEPTTVLTPQEVAGLFQALRALAQEGKTVLFISHVLEEVCEIADHATVLRGGRAVGQLSRAELSPALLARLMVGEVPARQPHAEPRHAGPPALRLSRVSTRVRGTGDRPLHLVDLSVGAGEIVAIAGIDGNGQAELAEVIVGLRSCDGGVIEIDGTEVNAASPAERRRLGVALIPADRMTMGVNLMASLWENVSAGLIASGKGCRFGVVRRRQLRRRAEELLAAVGVRSGAQLKARALSGGNIQRLVVARELATSPKVLVAAHPTHGVDVRGTAFIQEQLLRLRETGCAILLISSSLDEIAELADRVYVLHAGRIAGRYVPGEVSAAAIGLMMSGATVNSRLMP